MKITFSSHLELFQQLTELVKNNEAFYITEQVMDGHRFFIFNYRLASYSNFCEPGAFNARGTMFEVDDNGNFIRLACLPFHKFFNLMENPFVMDLDLSQVNLITAKLDGSLISSYIVDGKLKLKTKGSLNSEQAVDAMVFIGDGAYAKFVHALTLLGYTVNFEWTSTKNRVVVGYPSSMLRILSVRHMLDGTYMSYKTIREHISANINLYMDEMLVADFTDQYKDDMNGFVVAIADMTGIEGFVIQLRDGTTVKIKTTWYSNLHHTKDSVNNPRRLYECIVNETSDDLRTLFFDDPVALSLIIAMEEKVSKLFNHMISVVETFYETNKHLDRKSYAILGKDALEHKYFGLAMSKYIGKEVNWKEFAIKNYKEFGIKDTVLAVE